MSNKKKGTVAASIFTVLLVAGWVANEWNQRLIDEKGLDPSNQILIQGGQEVEIPQAVPFKPREYIRIAPR
ncbi:hypothetical protein M3212_12230 [Alkalihalobacillus oceani]|uniref:hypothetical protein n=1 Tax=Halalkalibacter oceani TaxID=1653776 RepID=UPI00203C0666|nr:hypothetical protein [Halalkalibacter oceani]MCM3761553.1 hypothetical protein [Halalkalibacter oceani]